MRQTLPFRFPSASALLLALCFPAGAMALQSSIGASGIGTGGSDRAVETVDGIFEAWDSTRSPGCAVAVARDGTPVLRRAYGMADLEHGVPNTPATVFEAGSVSKQFTAAAVVLLVLDGHLSFDDDVRDHLPELPDYGEPIRVHHLLNHTSGLRDWGSVAGLSGWGRSDRTHDHEHVLEIAVRQESLNYPPGAAYSYTNTGFNLLAILVERVTGESFATFSRDRIFEPLGLHHTEWRDDYRRIVPGRSSAYSPEGDGFRINRPIEHVHGNGGLLTTVEDLLVWDEALRTASFHGPEFVDLMHRQGVLTNGRTISYASGLTVDERRGVPVVSHTGATSGYRAYLGRYPEQALSIALLCNVTNANPGGLGNQVADVFLGDLPEPTGTTEPEAIALPALELDVRPGLYHEEDTGAPIRIVREEETGLRLGNAPLTPLSPHEYRVGSGERRLHFEAPPGEGPSPFSITDAGYPDGRYLPIEPASPAVTALREYEGHYRSDEAETTWEVRVEGDGLVILRRPATRMALTPVYADAFQGSPGLLRFTRDPQGTIDGFRLRQARIHDLRFDREPVP